MAYVTGILSGKGGVGKTTITLNLGMAMKNLGETVHIVDGDMKNPSIGLYLGLYKFSWTINDFLRRRIDFDYTKYDYNGLNILPASLSLSHTGVGFSKLKGVFDGLLGHVLIDFPPGLSRDILDLLEICDRCIIITTPTIVSLASTIRFVNILNEYDKEILGIVVNMAGKKYEISSDKIESIFTQNILGSIPEDDNARKSAIMKRTALEMNPYASSSIAIMELASRLLGKSYKKPPFPRLKRLLNGIRMAG